MQEVTKWLTAVEIRWENEPLAFLSGAVSGAKHPVTQGHAAMICACVSLHCNSAASPKHHTDVCVCNCFDFTEHITQSIVKSHLETCQYSAEDMKRFNYVQYTPEETRAFQNKVHNARMLHLRSL